MRETLFKAKRADNGEWVEGFYINNPRENEDYIALYEHNELTNKLDWVVYTITLKTLCQYTGLQDKNGKKIFENDVVKARIMRKTLVDTDDFGNRMHDYEEDTSEWTIEYKERYTQGGGFWCYGKNRRFNTRLTESRVNMCNLEVIGNIHDRSDNSEPDN